MSDTVDRLSLRAMELVTPTYQSLTDGLSVIVSASGGTETATLLMVHIRLSSSRYRVASFVSLNATMEG